MSYRDISEMIGKVFTVVKQNGDSLVFSNSNEMFLFEHEQDCCENVYIESIVGDLNDLIGVPILRAERATSHDPAPTTYEPESYTWTFYKFATIKGYVDIRWFGSSNGYYGEGVSIIYRKLA